MLVAWLLEREKCFLKNEKSQAGSRKITSLYRGELAPYMKDIGVKTRSRRGFRKVFEDVSATFGAETAAAVSAQCFHAPLTLNSLEKAAEYSATRARQAVGSEVYRQEFGDCGY